MTPDLERNFLVALKQLTLGRIPHTSVGHYLSPERYVIIVCLVR